MDKTLDVTINDTYSTCHRTMRKDRLFEMIRTHRVREADSVLPSDNNPGTYHIVLFNDDTLLLHNLTRDDWDDIDHQVKDVIALQNKPEPLERIAIALEKLAAKGDK